MELPDDLPILERNAVRVVVQDAAGDVLLLLTRELSLPGYGTWWELPGGGLEPGESAADAAIRELAEETGLVIDRASVGPPTWVRTASFRHRQLRHLQHEVVLVARLGATRPDIVDTGRLDYELEDYLGHCWRSVADICSGVDRYYPGRLPHYLPALLAGEPVTEPFELFN